MGWRRRRKPDKLRVHRAAAHDRRLRCWKSTIPIIRSAPSLYYEEPEGAGEEAHGGILEGAGAEISRLFRGLVEGQWRRLRHRPPRRPMSICRCSRSWKGCATPFRSACRRFEREIPAPDRAARPRRRAAEHQGVSFERAADSVQRGRDFPTVQGAGFVDSVIPCTLRCPVHLGSMM